MSAGFPQFPDRASVYLGLLLDRLFTRRLASVSARPGLGDVLRMNNVHLERLSDLGVDSLMWMQLLTDLETELNVTLGDQIVEEEFVTGQSLVRLLMAALDLKTHRSVQERS